MVFLVFSLEQYFSLVDVLNALVGDDIFALLICDEDLEYGAHYFLDQLCVFYLICFFGRFLMEHLLVVLW